MISPPQNFAFMGSVGRSEAFAAFGQASTPYTLHGLLEPRKRLLCPAKSIEPARRECIWGFLRMHSYPEEG